MNEDDFTVGFKLYGQGELTICLEPESKVCVQFTFRAENKEDFLNLMENIAEQIYKENPND